MSLADYRSLFTEEPKKTWRSGLGPSGGSWRAQAVDDAMDDNRFGAFQQAWRNGATDADLFGDNPFELKGSVDAGNSVNRRADVAKVETFLDRTGHYKPLKDGPSGYVSNSLDEAIRGFQTDNGLDADGVLNPGGPTIAALSNAVGEGRNASGMVHVRAYEQGRDGKTVRVSDYDRRRPGDAAASPAGGRGEPSSLLRLADSGAVKADATPERPPRKSSLDADKFADALGKKAKPKTQNECGTFVREALNASGIDLPKGTKSAKDFGPGLETQGFKPVDEAGYVPQKGDIVVIQPYEGGNKNGHIAAYDGKQWVSDFKQRDFWGGPGYRTLQPSHQFYRFAP